MSLVTQPDDLLKEIIDYLPDRDQLNARLLSKQFKKLIDNIKLFVILDNVTRYKYQTGLIIDLKKLVNHLKPGSVVLNELTTMLCSEDIPRDCIIDLIDDKKIDAFWGVQEEKKQPFDCNFILEDKPYKPQRLALWYDCFPKDMCEHYIAKAESAELQTIFKKQRVMWDDQAEADNMWNHLKVYDCLKQLNHHKMQDIFGDTWKAVGFNKRFRLVKYENGQGLGRHCDTGYEDSPTKKSMVTVTVYLNTIDKEYQGQTYFNKSHVNIQPIQGNGMLIWIDDDLEHQAIDLYVPDGKPEVAKYIIRTDIMYECDKLKHPEIRQKIFDLRRQFDGLKEGEFGKQLSQIHELEDEMMKK